MVMCLVEISYSVPSVYALASLLMLAARSS